VNFGDPLHATVLGGLDRATREFSESLVCLAMGSSLSVSPANALPLLPAHLVIVNLQSTDLDDHAAVRVWSTSDAFMGFLAKEVRMPVPVSSKLSAVVSSHPRGRREIARARALRDLLDGVEYGKEKEEERQLQARATKTKTPAGKRRHGGRGQTKRMRAPTDNEEGEVLAKKATPTRTRKR